MAALGIITLSFRLHLRCGQQILEGKGTRANIIPHGIYRHLKTTRLLIQVQRGRVRRV
jgi:hypothetical protein